METKFKVGDSVRRKDDLTPPIWSFLGIGEVMKVFLCCMVPTDTEDWLRDRERAVLLYVRFPAFYSGKYNFEWIDAEELELVEDDKPEQPKQPKQPKQPEPQFEIDDWVRYLYIADDNMSVNSDTVEIRKVRRTTNSLSASPDIDYFVRFPSGGYAWVGPHHLRPLDTDDDEYTYTRYPGDNYE